MYSRGNSHTWTRGNEKSSGFALTLCAAARKPGVIAMYKGRKLESVRVSGVVNSANIVKACAASNLIPVCNSLNYSDGACWYSGENNRMFSIPSHAKTILKKDYRKLAGLAIYCGNSNRGWALRNTGHKHKWTNSRNKNMLTLCTTPNKESNLKYKDIVMKTVYIKKGSLINADSSIAACKAKQMVPVCNRNSQSDAYCRYAGQGNKFFSHPTNQKQLGVNPHQLAGVYIYAGRNVKYRGRMMYSRGNSQAWTTGNTKSSGFALTLCTAARKPGVIGSYRGKKLESVRVSGVANAANIIKACAAKKLIPVCNHPNYRDGACWTSGEHKLFSLDSQAKWMLPKDYKKLAGLAIYMKKSANRGLSFINKAGSQRWSNKYDINILTLCASK